MTEFNYPEVEAGFVVETTDDAVVGAVRMNLREAAMAIWNNISEPQTREILIQDLHNVLKAIRQLRKEQ